MHLLSLVGCPPSSCPFLRPSMNLHGITSSYHILVTWSCVLLSPPRHGVARAAYAGKLTAAEKVFHSYTCGIELSGMPRQLFLPCNSEERVHVPSAVGQVTDRALLEKRTLSWFGYLGLVRVKSIWSMISTKIFLWIVQIVHLSRARSVVSQLISSSSS